jgi:predicted pyridoxine 5'-phosphate oxidase superfamily flavin-nucleotide-binding protein
MLLIVALGTMLGVSFLAVEGIKRLSVTEGTAIRAEKHIMEHDRNAEEWRARIRTLERQVEELKTNGTARADPFTGTMGKALEMRIQAVEKSLAGIGSLTAEGECMRSPREAK